MTQRSERTQPFHEPRRSWTPRVIGTLLVLALSLLLILENWDRVNVNLLIWDTDIRLAWALLGAFLLGGLTGGLLTRLVTSTRRSRVRVTTTSGER